MSRAWLWLSKYGLDLLIVTGAVISALYPLLREDRGRPTGMVLWLEMAAIAGVVLSLLGRRRFPFAAPAGTWLASAALSFVDGRLIVTNDVVFVAGMGAAVLLGNLRHARQSRAGLAIVLGAAATVVYNDPATSDGGDLVFTPLLFALGWLVGFALRARAEQTEAAEERAARAERDREAAARVAVAEERGRIARELHDVVAHAVSVMVLQVGAVRHRMPPSDEGRETLRHVEEAGRTALAEMRRLLNAMRNDDDELELVPHPGLDDLDALVDDVRAAGLPVKLQVHGEALPLPPGLDLSAFRILQEGLTNALKHARARRAEVDVHYDDSALLLEVRDDGPGGSSSSSAGLGHGLVGIGERVKIYGGEMTAGRAPAGGFLLRVRLPYEGGD